MTLGQCVAWREQIELLNLLEHLALAVDDDQGRRLLASQIFDDEPLQQLGLAVARAADDVHVLVALLVGEREGDRGVEQRLQRRIRQIGGYDLARRSLVFVRHDELVIGCRIFDARRLRESCGRAACGCRRTGRARPRPGRKKGATSGMIDRRRVGQHVDERKGGERLDLVASGEILRRRLGDRRQCGDEIQIAFAQGRIEDFEGARRVGRLALMRDQLVAIAALLDRVGGGERRQGIVEVFGLVQRFGDVAHGQVDVVRRQVVANGVDETVEIRVDEFLGVGKIGGDAALLGLGVELIGRCRPVDVPMNAFGDREDEDDRQQKHAADDDKDDGDQSQDNGNGGVQ